MADFSIKHKFVSPKPDGAETDLVRPSDWNAEHAFELTGSGAVARLGAGTGPAAFVPFGTGANEIPLNSHLGSAAYATLGNAIGNALEVIDVGAGVAGLPVLDGRNLTNLTLDLDEDAPLPVASTSQQGIVQLTNSFSSTSQTLAVTPKALTDGLSSVEWPGTYTGTSRDNTNFPIGTILMHVESPVVGEAKIPQRNGAVGPLRALAQWPVDDPSALKQYVSSDFDVGPVLSGTWRSRGANPAGDGGLAQRVA